MEVKVISSEMIKPSSPTPSHLKTFKLSFLDQLFPRGEHASVNLFYLPPSGTSSSNNTTALFIDQLKISLSKTLTRFYPLAAKINEDDNISIECNDEGALFTHVHLGFHMSQFLKPPINHNLLYGGGDDDDSGCGAQIWVRLNEFACGGICIGVGFLHRIIDGATKAAFLKYWAASTNPATTNNTTCNSITTIIDQEEEELRAASKLFPPKEAPESYHPPNSPSLNTKKKVWSRFVFDAKAISTLKSMIIPTKNNENPPSRVILVSSFILNHVIAAASSSASTMTSQKLFLVFGLVNMRPRIGPPLSQNSLGNLLWAYLIFLPPPLVTSNKVEMMTRLVGLQREAITEINRDFLKRFQGEEGYVATRNYNIERSKRIFGLELKIEAIRWNSWCRFGYDELDFGWGKPLWYCNDARVPDLSSPTNFLLIDTPTGNGIEAQLMLDEDLMTKLQLAQDFLALASINPSILP